MLSTALQTSTNTTRANTEEKSAAPAAASSSATYVGVNDLQKKNVAAEQQVELFPGQLSDALVSAESAAELIAAELTATENPGEQVVAAPTSDQSGFNQSDEQQQQPNAEAWLQAMLDQQQLQLQARDSDSAATLATPVAIVTPVVADVNGVNQALIKTAASAQASQSISMVALEKFAHVNLANNTFGSAIIQQQVQADSTNQSPVTDKFFDAAAKAASHQSTVNSMSAGDLRTADVSNAASSALNSTANSTVNSTAAINSSAINAAQNAVLQTVAAMSESNTGDAISSGVTPVALTTHGAESAQRSVQSHLSLHAPEAKWGEQLLHALRDNVQVQIQQKIQNATIRLDPPELGSLEIYLSHESGRLQVQITASHADVARLIQHTSDRLRQELSGPQFTHVNIQTSAEGQSGQQQSRERQRFVNDELILANEQAFAGNDEQTKRPGDILVTV